MNEFISANLLVIASACSALCVVFSTFVVVNFLSETSAKYKERYIHETALQYDDVLISMPPGRVFDISLAFAALGIFLAIGLLCLLTDQPTVTKCCFAGFLAACAAFPAPRLYLRYLKKKRFDQFNEQLEDALLSISSSLKAGFSIIQALGIIASENRHPISYEFTLLTQELRLGVPFETARDKMAVRIGSSDFTLVATAINTARQTGGELTTVLERLAAVIRERLRIQRKLNAMTSMGKLQAKIIGVMPLLLIIAIAKIAPDMMDSFFASILGVGIMLAALVLDVCGFLVIRKITTVNI